MGRSFAVFSWTHIAAWCSRGRLLGLFAVLLAATPAFAADAARTPLDEYIQAPDASYTFRLARNHTEKDYKMYVLEMTSQAWRTPSEVNRTLWKHWLVIYRPDEVRTSTALLFIGGGSNRDKAPAKPKPHLSAIARATHSVVAEVRMVPNQPLSFTGDSFGPRSEDQIIAYNWDRYLKSADVEWLTRLPMTKSAVRAMDTVTAFVASLSEGAVKLDRFFLAGGSKRGWTAWTTAAVDPRVIGISPLVIDLLNIKPSFVHHYRVYGFWAPAIKDYYDMGIMDHMDDPKYARLLEIVGPYSYRKRYTMPKFLINSAGDQFFLPDSSQFYFDELPGEKYLRYVPNCDHSLRDTDAVESMTAFYHALLTGTRRPEFSWTFEDDGAIRVTTGDKPSAVKLWHATNSRHRDFRLESVGPIYESKDLGPQKDGRYVGRVETPEQGFTAFFVELTYPSGMKHPFKFTTAVRVLPDRYPHGRPVAGQTKIGPKKQ